MEGEDHALGLRRAGEREAHIVGEQLDFGAALSLCGKTLTLWPLMEGVEIRLCQSCRNFAIGARMAKP